VGPITLQWDYSAEEGPGPKMRWLGWVDVLCGGMRVARGLEVKIIFLFIFRCFLVDGAAR